MTLSKYDGRTKFDGSMTVREFDSFMKALDELDHYSHEIAAEMSWHPEKYSREFELIQLYWDREDVFHNREDVQMAICEMIANSINGNADVNIVKGTFEEIIVWAERSGYCKPC